MFLPFKNLDSDTLIQNIEIHPTYHDWLSKGYVFLDKGFGITLIWEYQTFIIQNFLILKKF